MLYYYASFMLDLVVRENDDYGWKKSTTTSTIYKNAFRASVKNKINIISYYTHTHNVNAEILTTKILRKIRGTLTDILLLSTGKFNWTPVRTYYYRAQYSFFNDVKTKNKNVSYNKYNA